MLPLAIATAVFHGFHDASRARRIAWWLPVGLIAVASFLAVSRSAIVGVAVALLATIPARERRILILRFFGNMTQSQIAADIGISQMHVSRLLSQTLAKLREGLLKD